MSAEANSESRLCVTLGAWDRIVAISQNGVNSTLEYLFNVKKTRHVNFSSTSSSGLELEVKGHLNIPQIELISDTTAYYVLTFSKDVTFTCTDSDGNDYTPADITTWKLRFNVSFDSKSASLPSELGQKVHLSHTYRVERLAIKLVTDDAGSFNWENSKIDLDSNIDQDDVGSFLVEMLQKWQNPEEMTLFYAVQTTDRRAGPFPATHMSYNIQEYKGEEDSSMFDDDDEDSRGNLSNAFLFLEMTQGRPSPDQTPDWSGDWFYSSLGGTMAISKELFIHRFLGNIAGTIEDKAGELARRLSDRQAYDASDRLRRNRRKYPAPFTEKSVTMDGNSRTARFSSDLVERKLKWDDAKYPVDVELRIVVESIITPEPGSGRLTLEFNLKIETDYYTGPEWGWYTRTQPNWKFVIQLRSVDTGGYLVADVVLEKGDMNPWLLYKEGGRVKHETGKNRGGVEDEKEFKKYSKLFTSTFADIERNVDSIRWKLERELNGQRQFVFPAGGTFDMKQPIFSNDGDLLVGLSYREGIKDFEPYKPGGEGDEEADDDDDDGDDGDGDGDYRGVGHGETSDSDEDD